MAGKDLARHEVRIGGLHARHDALHTVATSCSRSAAVGLNRVDGWIGRVAWAMEGGLAGIAAAGQWIGRVMRIIRDVLSRTFGEA